MGNNSIKCKKLVIFVSGRRKCSTTLLQAKTGKHECRNITATFGTLLLHFCPGQKHVNFIIWNELYAWLTYMATQINLGMSVTMAKNCRNFISCYFMLFSNISDLKNTIICIRNYIQCIVQSKIYQTCSFLKSFCPNFSEYFDLSSWIE